MTPVAIALSGVFILEPSLVLITSYLPMVGIAP